MKIILIDESQEYVDIFKEYYKSEAPNLKIVRCFNSGLEALSVIKNIDADSFDFIVVDPLLNDISDIAFIFKLSNLKGNLLKRTVIITSINYGAWYKSFLNQNKFVIPSLYKFFVFDKLLEVLEAMRKRNKQEIVSV